ncbi:hypothetical protein, partial [Mycobacterium tuberculosis]
MSNVLDAISTEHRPVIEQELENRNPALFDELRRTEKPTNEQSDAVIDVLSDALMKTFGEPPRHVRRLQFLERMGSCQVVHRGG